MLPSHRYTVSLRSLTSLSYHFLDKKLADLTSHSTAFGLASIPLANVSLLRWSDEAVDGSMIQDSLLGIVLAFLVCLGPHVSIQLTMPLASWT